MFALRFSILLTLAHALVYSRPLNESVLSLPSEDTAWASLPLNTTTDLNHWPPPDRRYKIVPGYLYLVIARTINLKSDQARKDLKNSLTYLGRELPNLGRPSDPISYHNEVYRRIVLYLQPMSHERQIQRGELFYIIQNILEHMTGAYYRYGIVQFESQIQERRLPIANFSVYLAQPRYSTGSLLAAES